MKGRVLKMAQALFHDPGKKGERFRALVYYAYQEARSLRKFTSDDLRKSQVIEMILEDLGDPRYLGLAIRLLESKGLIKKTDIFVPTRRPEAHSRPIRVYECRDGDLILPYQIKSEIWEKVQKMNKARLGVIPLDEF